MKKGKLYFLVLLMALFVYSSCGETDENIENLTDNLEELVGDIENNIDVEDSDAAQPEQEKFYSKDGKFKILFSGNPSFSKEIVPIEGLGDLDMFMYIYEEISRAEMMAYIDYPPEILGDPEVMLQNAKEGSVSSMGLIISEEKEFEFKGNKALQFRADNKQLYVDYLMFLVGNRFFQAAIMAEGYYPSGDEVDKFYNSVELLNE